MALQRKRQITSLSLINLKFIVDDLFLENGYYENISSGNSNYLGEDKSQLIPNINDEFFPGNSSTSYAWEGFSNNWVYESDLTIPSGFSAPIVSSGIYVGNQFFTRTSITGINNSDGISIDYINGKVVALSGISTNSIVRSNFSRKHVTVDFPNKYFRKISNSQRFGVFDSSASVSMPTGEYVQLPLVIIEHNDDVQTPLSLGRGRTVTQNIIMWVVSTNYHEKLDIMDTLCSLFNKKFPIVDIDVAGFPLDDYNNLKTDAKSLSTMQLNNSIISPVTGQKMSIYIKSAEKFHDDDINEEIFVGRVDIEIEIDDIDFLYVTN